MVCNKLIKEAFEGIEAAYRLEDKYLKEALTSQVSKAVATSTTSGLAGGLANGTTIDEKGNITIDSTEFVEGAVLGFIGGAVGYRYRNKRKLASDLSHIYKTLSKGDKQSLLKMIVEPKLNIITDAYTPDLSDITRFELMTKKVPKALKDGAYELDEMWNKGKFFIDWDGLPRRWIDITKINKLEGKYKKATTLLPEIKKSVPELETKVFKTNKTGSKNAGAYIPFQDKIDINVYSEDTLVHEIQHAVQHKHGMQSGTNPRAIKMHLPEVENPMLGYMANLGEIYARFAGNNNQTTHPFLEALNTYGIHINIRPNGYQGPIKLLFGDISNNKAEIIDKIISRKVTASDLPEVRRLIQGILETGDKNFVSSEELLTKYSISKAKPVDKVILTSEPSVENIRNIIRTVLPPSFPWYKNIDNEHTISKILDNEKNLDLVLTLGRANEAEINLLKSESTSVMHIYNKILERERAGVK